MMKPITLTPSRKLASVLFAMIFVILSPFQDISAQQVSTFSIPGWASGTNPVFSGAGSNVIALQYGDSLTTSINFAGSPTDGFGADQDNIAFQSFSYSYSVYLTPVGSAFSSASILIGSHTVSANQSCNSGTMPPWSISYDANAARDSNNIHMAIHDGIADCIAAGDYQVDIVLDSYAVNSVGSAVLPLQLEWDGYTNSSPTRVLTQLMAPSTDNTAEVSLNPVNSYLLSKIAFVHIAPAASCPPVNLSMPGAIHTFAAETSATVSASYTGQCTQNACSYLWSDGETTATAVHLSRGTYTVTVTSPCGATAEASITISTAELTNTSILSAPSLKWATEASEKHPVGDNIKAKKTSAHAQPEVQMSLYPNPAKNRITFDFHTESNTGAAIRIYDMVGNQVMILSGSPEAGNQKIEANLDELPSGVYLYELEAEGVARGKFVKE